MKAEELVHMFIELEEQYIPLFLKDLFAMKYFHIRDLNGITLANKDDLIIDEEASNVCCALSDSDIERMNDSLNYIEKYLDTMKYHLKEANLEECTDYTELDLKFDTLNGLINRLLDLVETEDRKLNAVSKQLEIIQLKIEELVKISSIFRVLIDNGAMNFITKELDMFNFELYTVSHNFYRVLRKALDGMDEPIIMDGQSLGSNIVGFYAIYEKKYEELFFELFLTFNCHKVNIPEKYFDDSGLHIFDLRADFKQMLDRADKAKVMYLDMLYELQKKFPALEELFQNTKMFIEIAKKFKRTETLDRIRLDGYIPKKIAGETVKALKKQFNSHIFIYCEGVKNVNPYEPTKDNQKKVPSLIKLRKIAEPFKILTDMYGTTNYYEIDPSTILLFSFPLIFGLMFGDVGHGLTLIAAGLIGRQYFQDKKENTAKLCMILFWCGLGAIFGGLVYGECFGKHLMMGSTHVCLFHSPMDAVTSTLKMAVMIGVVFIIFGWILRFINLTRNDRIILAVTDPLVKISIMIGGTWLIFTYMFDIFAWLAAPYPILAVIIPSIAFIILKPLGVVRSRKRHDEDDEDEKSEGLLLETFIDFAETMLQIVSNVASFVRIVALEIAHISLMIVIYEIINLTGTSFFSLYILQPIILILGNLFVILLEVIVVFIHTLRLHFYEFFSKFYVGNGREFKVINLEQNYSRLSFATTGDVVEELAMTPVMKRTMQYV